MLIEYKDSSILTDPYFTPISLFSTLVSQPLKVDTSLIDKNLKGIAKNIDAIVVGHGHHDHALAIPYVSTMLSPNTPILASNSVAMMLSANVEQPFINANKVANSSETPGKWQYFNNNQFRILAIVSEHAPQFLNINLLPGSYTELQTELPSHSRKWKQGKAFTYLIDFLSTEQEIVYRIHIQTSASASPLGIPNLKDNRPADISIFAAASFNNVDNYPAGLIKALQPKKIIICHWEDFFQSFNKEAEAMQLVDFELLFKKINDSKLKGSEWVIPKPGSWIRYPEKTQTKELTN